MGFNLGAALGGATTGFQTTWKDMNEEARRKEEETRRKAEYDYLQEQRQKEKDYNTAISGLPGVGEQYNFDQSPQGMRPPEPIGATYTQSPTMPAALDSSLEGTPAGALPAAGEPVRTRKVTQGDLYHMQAAAARKAGYGEKSVEYSRLANQEDMRGMRALLFRGAATGGWDGIKEALDKFPDGNQFTRKQNKDGTSTISYGGGQEVVVSSPMQAAMLASAAMEGDPDRTAQLYNQFADDRLRRDTHEAQVAHWGQMARLNEQELAANKEYRRLSLELQREGNANERAKIEAQMKPEKEFADLSRQIYALMADPFGNETELNALSTQLAAMFPNKVMTTIKDPDGNEIVVNGVGEMIKSAAKERRAAVEGSEVWKSGAVYRDPLKGGYRVRGLEAQGIRYTDWNSAVAAANSLATKKESSAAPGALPTARASSPTSQTPPGRAPLTADQIRQRLAVDDRIKASSGGSVGRAIKERALPLGIAERREMERRLAQLEAGK